MNNRAVALAALFLAFGIFVLYIMPAWNGPIADTKVAIESNDKALIAAEEYGTRQEELAAKRDSIDPKSLDRLETFLPNSVDNVRLILALNALAAREGLSLSNIDVSANTPNVTKGSAQRVSPVSSIDLSLSAVGSFSSFKKFLNGVEYSQRLLDVQSLSIAGSDTGVYTYQMTLRLYWLR